MEAEVVEQTEEVEQKEPQLASTGTPERLKQTVAIGEFKDKVEPQEAVKVETEVEKPIEQINTEEKQVELSDEQLKELYEKRFAPTRELTEEEKAVKLAEKEKEMLDLYVTAGGGTIENFAALKGIINSDLTDLSKRVITDELKAAGLEEEVEAVLKERYYQVQLEELEQDIDEDDDEFAARKAKIEKKIEYGKKKLQSIAEKIKKDAQGVFDSLSQAIENKKAEANEELEFVAKIDEVSKTLPRKLSIPLGKLNNEDLGSVEVEVSENEIAETIGQLKDPASRNKILFNEDNQINVVAVSNLLLRNKMLEKAVREGMLVGQDRQVKIFEKTFPNRSAQAVGLGGSPKNTNTSGQVAGFGKPQRMR